jgi:hypothetical protein
VKGLIAIVAFVGTLALPAAASAAGSCREAEHARFAMHPSSREASESRAHKEAEPHPSENEEQLASEKWALHHPFESWQISASVKCRSIGPSSFLVQEEVRFRVLAVMTVRYIDRHYYVGAIRNEYT